MTGSTPTDSWWMDTAPGGRYPPLDHDVTTDVAIVGAGIVGISAARELSRSGLKVSLLEAETVAAGVTGHTTAKLTSLHGLAFHRIASDHGAEAAHLYARSQDDAIRHVVDTAEHLDIDCELETLPAYTWSGRANMVDRLHAEARAAADAGLEASFTTETDLPFPVAGAVRMEDQYQFHPRQYLLGVLAAMDGNDVAVHEQTRIVGLQEGQPCRLTTADGHTVTADHVLVATHYPIFDRSLLFARLTPTREVVIAGPLEGGDLAGMYITPDQRTRSARTAPLPDGGRLLIVTGERFRPGSSSTGKAFARLTKWATDNFQISAITHRWATQDNHSTDGLPLIGPLHPFTNRVWVAAGFGGWGMSNGVMAARLLTSHITGEPLPEWGALYDTRRFDLWEEALPLAKAQAVVAAHFVGDRLRHLGSGVDALKVGEGKIILAGGRHLAVHRTPEGQLTALSARCTHLGCLVQFNHAEQSWDCPCHGSRFDLDGSVVHGPATAPLSSENQRIEISSKHEQ